jgi:hypothetical protein
MGSKEILNKLIKIANNQQKIIEKLAQKSHGNLPNQFPSNSDNELYLRRAIPVAMANTGLKSVHFSVNEQLGGMKNGVSIPNTYIINIMGAQPDNTIRQNFINVLKKQVSLQKSDQPDLAENLSIIFN